MHRWIVEAKISFWQPVPATYLRGRVVRVDKARGAIVLKVCWFERSKFLIIQQGWRVIMGCRGCLQYPLLEVVFPKFFYIFLGYLCSF